MIGTTIDGWRGAPLTGYQSVYNWYRYGDIAKVNQVLDFLSAAQTAYTAQNINGTDGFFAPYYRWPTWEQGASGNDINTFGFKGCPDPNFAWSGYQTRAVEDVARYWISNPKDYKAQSIVMRFLGATDKFYKKRGSILPATDYPEFQNTEVKYIDIHSAALHLRAALYANVAVGNPAITFRIIKKSLDLLNSEWVGTGVMKGSFTASQPSFTSSSVTYKECFGFHIGEIMFSLCEVLRLAPQIVYPSCNTSLI
jgi:hypothetical protein